ncbi:MAG: cupin domain-containing protein [Asticcacaulis sp.]
MKFKQLLPALMLLVPPASFAQSVGDITVARPDPAKGSPETFTGDVEITSRFQRQNPARVGGGEVTFSSGARTAWHTHPLGQTLIITRGEGWVQKWGENALAVKAGDVVWIPPEVKHWHGATRQSGMSHIAISETLDGKSVDWLEQVTDAQYPTQ